MYSRTETTRQIQDRPERLYFILMAWECLGILPENLVGVARERVVSASKTSRKRQRCENPEGFKEFKNCIIDSIYTFRV